MTKRRKRTVAPARDNTPRSERAAMLQWVRENVDPTVDILLDMTEEDENWLHRGRRTPPKNEPGARAGDSMNGGQMAKVTVVDIPPVNLGGGVVGRLVTDGERCISQVWNGSEWKKAATVADIMLNPPASPELLARAGLKPQKKGDPA